MTDWTKVQSPLDLQKQSFDDLVNNSARLVAEMPVYKRTWDFVQNMRRETVDD